MPIIVDLNMVQVTQVQDVACGLLPQNAVRRPQGLAEPTLCFNLYSKLHWPCTVLAETEIKAPPS